MTSHHEDREVLRRLHADEPLAMTNVLGKAAQEIMLGVEQEWTRGDLPHDEGVANLVLAHSYATLALAQEVKNLRLAMYPHSGEAPAV